MKFNIDYNVGDYFTGVLLETFKEAGISRPRVKPVEMFADDIRVEFPRSLREDNPVGTQFRALVKVAQKTNKKTGKAVGVPYLVATNKTIDLVKDYSPIKQIYAIPLEAGDRLYKYVSQTYVHVFFQCILIFLIPALRIFGTFLFEYNFI